MSGANDDRIVDFALLNTAAGGRFLDSHLDDVTDVGITALGAAQHLDTHHRTSAGVIGDVQSALHLNHGLENPNLFHISG